MFANAIDIEFISRKNLYYWLREIGFINLRGTNLRRGSLVLFDPIGMKMARKEKKYNHYFYHLPNLG